MLLIKDEVRTFHQSTMQLRVFERNVKSANQEALVAKSDKQKMSNNNSIPTGNKKENICNYCHKEGQWVRSCRKWMADGLPARKVNSNNVQSNNVKTISLISIDNHVLAGEPNSTDWWVDNGAAKHVTNCSD